MVTIRNETEQDHRAVEELTRKAFWNVNYPGCHEHYLVHLLRHREGFLPELDLVAEKDGQLIGNILFAESKLVDENGGEKKVATFGPLSILPEYQRKGYGKQLMKAAMDRAATLGYEAVVIFGNPENYVSSGFKNCKKYRVGIAKDVYPVPLLVRELKEGALAGHNWVYAESDAYAVDMSGFQAFESTFPQMEKGYRYTQELFSIYSCSIVNR